MRTERFTVTMIPLFTLKKFFVAILGLSVFALVCYNMRDSIIGSRIDIETAQNGAVIENPYLPIKGVARHARELLINGRAITLDRSGSFDDGVVLSEGYNIIEVALKDQFGNQKITTYQIVVSTPTNVATTTPIPYQ